MKLIDIDKVEEILRNLWKEDDRHNPEHRICYNKALQEVQCEIDTLEVKEVDFDAEWKRYFEYRGEMATVNVKRLAKHFYELGMLSTITEEDCKLIYHISDELPCMREEDFFKEMLRRYKAQKGE